MGVYGGIGGGGCLTRLCGPTGLSVDQFTSLMREARELHDKRAYGRHERGAYWIEVKAV